MIALENLLRDLNGPDTGQQRDLLSRIAVEGRAITNILQNLRNKDSVGKAEFDRWYQPFVVQMKGDSLMHFFYKLRTSTLKEGDDRVDGLRLSPTQRGGFSINIEGVEQSYCDDQGAMRVVFYPAPPNAVSCFVADDTGGAGWEIKQPDGSITKAYATLHPGVAEVTSILVDPPKAHLGADLTDARPATLCTAYINYLRGLIQNARLRFLGGNAQVSANADYKDPL